MDENLIPSEKLYLLQIFSSILVFIIIFITAFGNILVITAILKTPKLRIRSNYLILSLSFTDLTVAVLSMPITAYLDIISLSDWNWGPFLCDMYYLLTAVCTSASVLHLLFIAIDRYLTVTRIEYSIDNKKRYVIVMICFAWIFALFVGLTPMFGWRDYQKFLDRIYKHKTCFSSLNIAYKVTSVIILFFGPVSIMIPLYYAIYKKSIEFHNKSKLMTKTSLQLREVSSSDANKTDEIDVNLDLNVCTQKGSVFGKNMASKQTSNTSKDMIKREKFMRREFRVAKTLAVITIVYIVCLLPVYTTLLVTVIKNDNQLSRLVFPLTLWLLLCNSGVNPILYAIFNTNFRNAFKKILRLY